MKAKIFPGILQGLDDIPHHEKQAGITRYKLTDNQSLPGKSFHTAVHIIGPNHRNDPSREYSSRHCHNHDEINLLLSEQGCLCCRFEMEGEHFLQQSPALIFIPAGVSHRVEVVSGAGMLVCMRFDAQEENRPPECV